jgi:chemotaxis protein histidine kinase CheA
MDEGGMSIRLDPRRLGALKLLAAEAGLRPGELVTRWVEERLDAARSGAASSPSAGVEAVTADLVAVINARIDALAQRLDAMADERSGRPAASDSAPAEASAKQVPVPEPASEPKRRRGRPPKAAQVASAGTPTRARRTAAMGPRSKAPRVALHDEIAAVIAERGPQTATELAAAIAERGRYHAPRSARPLDAAIVNARVSNSKYRPRFVRRARRIGLAEPATE